MPPNEVKKVDIILAESLAWHMAMMMTIDLGVILANVFPFEKS